MEKKNFIVTYRSLGYYDRANKGQRVDVNVEAYSEQAALASVRKTHKYDVDYIVRVKPA